MAATLPALRNLVVVSLIGLTLPACVRHEAMVTGSIKDGPVAPAEPRAKAVSVQKVSPGDDKPAKTKVRKASTDPDVAATKGPADAKAVEQKSAEPLAPQAPLAVKRSDAKSEAKTAAHETVQLARSATTVPAAATAQPVVAPRAAAAGTAVAPGTVPAPAPKVAAAPAAKPTTLAAVATTEGQDQTSRLIAEGRKLFESGKVHEARRRFIAALNSMTPDATLALAQSFDPYYVMKVPSSDAASDIGRALQLYTTAVERGSRDAVPDLARLRISLGLSPR